MKKIIICTIALIGISLLSSGYTEENLLKNPGFEEGLTDWQPSLPASVSAELDTTIKKSGAQSLRLSTEEPASASFRQRVSTEPSTAYTLSWNIKTEAFKVAQATSGSAFATVYTIQRDENNKVVYGGKIIQANQKVWLRGSQYTGQNIKEDMDWSLFYFTFETSPSTKSLEIFLCLAFGGRATGKIWFDDISFAPAEKNGEKQDSLQWKYRDEERSPAFSEEEKKKGYLLFTRNWMETLFPESLPKPGEINKTLSSFGTWGEYEPLLFAIRSLQPQEEISITPSALIEKKGRQVIPPENIEIRTIRFLPKKMEGGVIHAPVLLEPFKRMDIPQDTTQPFWITIAIPEGITGGLYQGTISISSKNGQPTTLPLEIEVFPYHLQEPKNIFWGMFDGTQHFLPHIRKKEYYKEKFTDMRAHGMSTVFLFGAGIPLSLSAEGTLSLAMDKAEEWKRVMEAYTAAGFPLPIIIDSTVFRFPEKNITEQSDFAGLYKKAWDLYKEESKKEKWPPLYVQPQDEMFSGNKLPKIMKFLPLLKESGITTVADQASRATPAMITEVSPYIDIFIYNSGPFVNGAYYREEWDNFLGQRHNKEKEIWYYGFASSPWHPEANRFAYGLLLWQTGATGMITYAYQRPYHTSGRDMYDDTKVPKNNYLYRYPTTNDAPGGPTPGWEGAREGVDDYKYLFTFFQTAEKKKNASSAKTRTIAAKEEKEIRDTLSRMAFEGLPRGEGSWTGGKRVLSPSLGQLSGTPKIMNNISFEDYQSLRKTVAEKTLYLLTLPE